MRKSDDTHQSPSSARGGPAQGQTIPYPTSFGLAAAAQAQVAVPAGAAGADTSALVVNALPSTQELARARLMDYTNPAFLTVVVGALIAFVATLPAHGLSPNVAYIVGGALGVVYTALRGLSEARGQSNMDKVLRSTGKLGGGK